MFSIYNPIQLPYDQITNYELERQLTKIHNTAMLVHDYGGNAVAVEIPYKQEFFTSVDVISILQSNGYKIEVTLNSKLMNLTVFNLEWRRKDGRHAENQSNLSGSKIKEASRQAI